MAEHLYTYDDPPSERDLDRIVNVLNDNGVIAYPTDINWAFGCDAASPKALARMHRLKPRHGKEQPFTLVCSSISMASDIGVINNQAYRMLKRACQNKSKISAGWWEFAFPRPHWFKRRSRN